MASMSFSTMAGSIFELHECAMVEVSAPRKTLLSDISRDLGAGNVDLQLNHAIAGPLPALNQLNKPKFHDLRSQTRHSYYGTGHGCGQLGVASCQVEQHLKSTAWSRALCDIVLISEYRSRFGLMRIFQDAEGVI